MPMLPNNNGGKHAPRSSYMLREKSLLVSPSFSLSIHRDSCWCPNPALSIQKFGTQASVNNYPWLNHRPSWPPPATSFAMAAPSRTAISRSRTRRAAASSPAARTPRACSRNNSRRRARCPTAPWRRPGHRRTRPGARPPPQEVRRATSTGCPPWPRARRTAMVWQPRTTRRRARHNRSTLRPK